MLAVANEKGINLNHWDVKQAYTYATVHEAVFLRLPAECGDKSHQVVLAKRAIYGLKQSGRQWGYHAADTPVENGFEQCKADPFVFPNMVDEVVVMIIIVIYVDDILVVGSDEDCEELLASLNKKFPTKNLGEWPKREDEERGEWPLREAIGSMMWVSTFSRPDVSFAVRAVARHAHAPAKRHWDAIQKILGYLKGTRDLGITYQRGSGLGLAVYVDASYADTEDRRSATVGDASYADTEDRRSATVGGTVASHGSKTQSIVSLSSTEAEYIAAGEGVNEALFVRAVLSFDAPETRGSSIQEADERVGFCFQSTRFAVFTGGEREHVCVWWPRVVFCRDVSAAAAMATRVAVRAAVGAALRVEGEPREPRPMAEAARRRWSFAGEMAATEDTGSAFRRGQLHSRVGA
ncbi:unnamed protein product [Ectocarpus sp. CCAP 1310/34]|nr:unnamed protein product [Ectocarpus sp. CCAP 1310/34]